MNKRMLLISALVCLMASGGAVFGWKWYSGTQPAFRGRAIPMNGIEEGQVRNWQDAFEKALAKDEVLQAIIDESNYASSLGISEGAALGHLRKAVVVRFKNTKKTIEVGLVGKRKQDEALKEISKVLYQAAEKDVLDTTPSFQAYLDLISKK